MENRQNQPQHVKHVDLQTKQAKINYYEKSQLVNSLQAKQKTIDVLRHKLHEANEKLADTRMRSNMRVQMAMNDTLFYQERIIAITSNQYTCKQFFSAHDKLTSQKNQLLQKIKLLEQQKKKQYTLFKLYEIKAENEQNKRLVDQYHTELQSFKSSNEIRQIWYQKCQQRQYQYDKTIHELQMNYHGLNLFNEMQGLKIESLQKEICDFKKINEQKNEQNNKLNQIIKQNFRDKQAARQQLNDIIADFCRTLTQFRKTKSELHAKNKFIKKQQFEKIKRTYYKKHGVKNVDLRRLLLRKKVKLFN